MYKTPGPLKKRRLCETYPKYFAVPRRHGDLAKVAAYRTRNRLPVLAWIHPETGAALLRSSQPAVGITEKKSSDDFEYLKQVRDLRMPTASKLLIFDCRPKAGMSSNFRSFF